jgi:RNA polymerase sigma factor (sigma-70 family)
VSSPRPTEQIMCLFEQFYEELYCYIRRYTTPAEAEDVSQQVFLDLAGRPDAATISITRTELLHQARELLRQRYTPLLRLQHALKSIRDGLQWQGGQLMRASEHQQPMATRRLRKLNRAMRQLPTDQRQAIRLVIAEGMDTEAASHRMGVTSSLVEAWTSSGLRRLDEWMCNHVKQNRRPNVAG